MHCDGFESLRNRIRIDYSSAPRHRSPTYPDRLWRPCHVRLCNVGHTASGHDRYARIAADVMKKTTAGNPK